MRSVILILLSLAAFGHAAVFNYTLDTASDVNSAYLRVLCSHYEQLENFTCSGAIPGIPAADRQGGTGFWTTCDREAEVKATPCTMAFFRTPNTFVVQSITVKAYHNGNYARIRVHTSNPNNLDRIFNATDAWGTYVIDASVYNDIESLDNIQITAETSTGFIVFDKIEMQFDDRSGASTTGSPVTTTTQGPTTTGRPSCENGTQFQCVEDGRCLPINWLCDGEVDCADGSDETPEMCPCGPNEFACADGQCVPGNSRCNLIPNCRDGSDEHMCPCPGPEENFFRCGGVGACIPLNYVCDGACDCVECDDEDTVNNNCTLSAKPSLRKISGKFFHL